MKQANQQTIKNAFARLKSTKDEVIRAAMYGLLEDAVQIALDAHDEKHQSHIELGDTYGWRRLLWSQRQITGARQPSNSEPR